MPQKSQEESPVELPPDLGTRPVDQPPDGITAPSGSTTYYVSISGDDANDGTSPQTPWRSIFKLNRTSFAPGDTILFKRGDVWDGANAAPIVPRTSGSAGRAIVWGAYGSGPKPVITFAANRNNPEDWTDEGGNIWSTGGITLTAGELLANPDLSMNAAGWYSQCLDGGASCSFTGWTGLADESEATPGAYKFVVEQRGTTPANVQMYTASSSPVSLIQGSYYLLTFRAKATAAFTIPDIIVRSGGEDVTSGMYVKQLAVGTDWTTCRFMFRADRTTTIAVINMLLGGITGIPDGTTLLIDSMSLREIADQDFFGMYHSANIIFNTSSGGTTTGKLVISGQLAGQGEWYQSSADRKIRVYSAGNPATFYQGGISIVNGSPKTGFYIIGKNFHTVEQLDFYALPSAWYGYDVSDHTIQYCTARYTGGNLMVDRYDYNWGSGAVLARAGESVGATGNVANWVVRYNDFSQTYDCNVTWQNTAANKKADNIWVYYNILGSAHYNIEFGWNGAGSSMSNIYIYNNTMYDAGKEWSANQRPDEPVSTHDAHIKCWNSPANSSNIYIRNNIMDRAVSQMLYFSDWSQWSGILSMSNNLYFSIPAKLARTSGNNYVSLADWQAFSNMDSSSLVVDPLFISKELRDFRLQSLSPARNAGTNEELLFDFARNSVPASRPAIGAFEY
ncbi:hypothetical protein KI809_17885 [Geobacter pelophilus]|uniref:Right handed beta helix region n=1 Tax=Geoanaerobacter pelophilus TaxID=60036 RepID=A0AAW4LCP3_9BACT|nr:hypothetical protein [Geoanaerobacter pelophilus]MBT0666186.1 hypothetical protein [Geoanaerobacter pelophilus]